MNFPDFVEEYNGIWLLKNDQSISTMVKKHGKLAYDTDLIDLPELNAMAEGSLVIDVGAFIGDTARIFLDKGFKVIAVEPQKDAFHCLLYNCKEAVNLNIALGDGRKVNLHPAEGGNMGGRPVIDGGDTETWHLDDIVDPDATSIFLKLDAEGFEPAILEGATNLLANPALKHIVCEFNPHALSFFGYTCEDILKYLPEWDYREIFRYGNENWDCIFTRR